MRKPLFGTSGVRGVVNQDLTPELCNGVGKALGTYLPRNSAVCLATDSRLSRELIKNVVIDGLTATGINVADIGIAPTPALALIAGRMGFDAGIMITASHNPPEFNGIKVFNGNSIGFDRIQEEQVEEIYYSNKFRAGFSGRVEKAPGLKRKYVDFIKSSVEGMNFNRKLKILIDAGNGAAAGFASDIFKQLGFQVITVNDVPDGRFPGRNPEPKEDTLKGTISFLKQKNADLAVCYDGDADRVVFCDQHGFLGFNEMIAFISRQAIKNNGKKVIATTVETGRLLELAIEDLGGRVMRGKVGDVYAAHLAKDNDAALGVEPVGVYIFPELGYYPDSIFAGLKLLGSISEASEIRAFLKSIPRLSMVKDKIHCPNELKAAAMEKVKDRSGSLNASGLNELDGLRYEFSNGWLLIRASGTEPALRVMAEARSAASAKSLFSDGMALVKGVMSEVS